MTWPVQFLFPSSPRWAIFLRLLALAEWCIGGRSGKKCLLTSDLARPTSVAISVTNCRMSAQSLLLPYADFLHSRARNPNSLTDASAAADTALACIQLTSTLLASSSAPRTSPPVCQVAFALDPLPF